MFCLSFRRNVAQSIGEASVIMFPTWPKVAVAQKLYSNTHMLHNNNNNITIAKWKSICLLKSAFTDLH